MKEEEVNHCQIQEWYPMFKSVSIKTLIHQLPESFIQHLLDDSGPFLLPVSVLNEDALPNRIHNPDEEEDFQAFFNNHVRAKFESENYAFDVYITKDERVKIVDSNPWGAFTLSLLFTWDELDHIHSEGNDVEFRIVEDRCAVRPGLKTAVPFDYLDTSPGSGSISKKMQMKS
ncbi:Cell division cycle protein 123 [Glycine soja]